MVSLRSMRSENSPAENYNSVTKLTDSMYIASTLSPPLTKSEGRVFFIWGILTHQIDASKLSTGVAYQAKRYKRKRMDPLRKCTLRALTRLRASFW